MAIIDRAEIFLVNLAPKTPRTDATQSFVCQETPIVRVTDSEGAVGVGYTYTIGAGGSAIVALLRDHLVPRLLGQDADAVEAVWRDLFRHTHACAVGALHSLALAAIDTALWDLRCRRARLPLYQMAGGAKQRIALYTTEGGWLQLTPEELVEDTRLMKEKGFAGAKFKVGKPSAMEDLQRLTAVRHAVGDSFEIMVDANQSFSVSEAIRRAALFQEVNVAWFEEPLPADNLLGHVTLCKSTVVPVAVGESLYSLRQFGSYLAAGACSIVQVDVARVGGITPWLKTAHLAEALGIDVCPHFLMELHVALCCAVPNSRWLEYIPQLDSLILAPLKIDRGFALPSQEVGLGIEWDWQAVLRLNALPPISISAASTSSAL